jgi:hypothetical protein
MQREAKDATMSERRSRPGDEVEPNSHGSSIHGEVQEKIATDTEAAEGTVRGSEDDPQYRVRGAKRGEDAVHKPDVL